MWNHGAGRAFSPQEGSSRVILKVGIRVAQFAVHGCRVARFPSRQGRVVWVRSSLLLLVASIAPGLLAARASRLVIAGGD